MSQQVDPSHIMQVGMGFWASKTLLSAVELELFTKLGSDAMTGPQIAEALELNARAIPDFPDALVALELLDREGEGSDALYRNTQATAVFLDKASPAYIGGILEMSNARLYPILGRPHRGSADRKAPERDQAHRQGDVRGALQRSGQARAVHERDGRDLHGPIQRAGGEVRFLQVRDALRRGRRNRSALDHRRRPPPPHALHELRPAGRRADRQANDRSRRTERARDGGGW